MLITKPLSTLKKREGKELVCLCLYLALCGRALVLRCHETTLVDGEGGEPCSFEAVV